VEKLSKDKGQRQVSCQENLGLKERLAN